LKIKKRQLQQIIQEETQKLFEELGSGPRLPVSVPEAPELTPEDLAVQQQGVLTAKSYEDYVSTAEGMRQLMRLAMAGDPDAQDLAQHAFSSGNSSNPYTFGAPGMPFEKVPLKQPGPHGYPQN